MWVYREVTDYSDPDRKTRWEVGFFTPCRLGQSLDYMWESPIESPSAAEAKIMVHYLNGGDAPHGLDPT